MKLILQLQRLTTKILSKFSLASFLIWPSIALYYHPYFHIPLYIWLGRAPIYAATNLALWGIFRLLLRSSQKADLALLSYTIAVLIATKILPESLWSDYPYNFVLGFIVVPPIYFIRSISRNVVLLLNSLLLFFLFASLARVGARLLYKRFILNIPSPPPCLQASSPPSTEQPDIYLILMDSYGAPTFTQPLIGSTLKLPTALQERGAITSEKITNPSMATYTCMIRLLFMNDTIVKEDRLNNKILYDGLIYSKLTRKLSSLGYSLKGALPRYYRLSRIPCIDWDFSYIWNIFDYSFFVASKWREWLGNTLYVHSIQRIIHNKLNKNPQMLYIHLMSSHDPYVIDKSGSYIVSRPKKERFIQGFLYTDSLVLALVQQIQSLYRAQTGRNYVILLFSDHGPRFYREHGFSIEDSSLAREVKTRCFAALLSSRPIPSFIDSTFRSCQDHGCLGQMLLEWVQSWPASDEQKKGEYIRVRH